MLQRVVFALGFLLTFGTAAAAAPEKANADKAVPAAAGPVQEHMIGVRVAVDAGGKVTSAEPTDPLAVPALNQAAVEIARKLAFDPATKDGVAAASQTTLFLTLAIEHKDDGRFGIRLKQASNGPDRSTSAPVTPPNYQQRGDRSAMVVVSLSLKSDGSPDMATFKGEQLELKVPSKFAEARYLDAISTSLRATRFVLDKVAGADIPVRLTLPYRFGGGGRGGRSEPKADASPAPGADAVAATGGRTPQKPVPEAKVESLVPGVTLAKVRFTAPAVAVTPDEAPAR